MIDKKYIKRRKSIEKFFKKNRMLPTKNRVVSPSGGYALDIMQYQTKDGCWNYTRGIVTRLSDGHQIADVKRNYGTFWHTWIQHPNGSEYLLCGEDYQGYTVINLSTGQEHIHFPREAYEGCGFCWISATPSPNRGLIAVEGCYWACPYEIVVYDFSKPDEGLEMIARGDLIGDLIGWKDEDTLHIQTEIDIRQSDGVDYDSLSKEERQKALDEKDIDSRYEDHYWRWSDNKITQQESES